MKTSRKSAGSWSAATAGLVFLSFVVACGCYSSRAPYFTTQSPMLAANPVKAVTVEGEDPRFHTEAYERIYENPFMAVADNPLSTFSIDVDTASFSNMRRFINDGQRPPVDAIRIEELINYFSYDYPEPKADEPFSVSAEVAACPWNSEHKLVHIGLQGKAVAHKDLPPRNLVFLIDVSGSMHDPRKLPLLKAAFRLLAEQLDGRDRVSMVVYAGASGLVLEPTSGAENETILAAFDKLSAGGSTNGGAGIRLAYNVARQNFIKGGINRVILATDGDFNVGTTSHSELVRLIEKERESGVFLTVLGFGTGNYKDSTMEKLADKGNGNYAYIDTIHEARKVLVTQAGSTLVTIAKDVKIQVEFNPTKVSAYRLIGYENRLLRAEDFNDDTKDAGEIGAGHTVTALYEVVPAGVAVTTSKVDALKYQATRNLTEAAQTSELLTLKLRYKDPDQNTSKLIGGSIEDRGDQLEDASDSYRFSAAVAAFGMLLRDSKYKGAASFAMVDDLAKGALGKDPHGYRKEFLGLITKAKKIKRD
jgi:Ca-activated chloride channel homolog